MLLRESTVRKLCRVNSARELVTYYNFRESKTKIVKGRFDADICVVPEAGDSGILRESCTFHPAGPPQRALHTQRGFELAARFGLTFVHLKTLPRNLTTKRCF